MLEICKVIRDSIKPIYSVSFEFNKSGSITIYLKYMYLTKKRSIDFSEIENTKDRDEYIISKIFELQDDLDKWVSYIFSGR